MGDIVNYHKFLLAEASHLENGKRLSNKSVEKYPSILSFDDDDLYSYMWAWVRQCMQTSFNKPLMEKANRIATGNFQLYRFTSESTEQLASFINAPHELEETEICNAEITHHVKAILNNIIINSSISESGKRFIPVVMKYIDSIRTKYHVPDACDERLLIEVMSRLGAAAWEAKNRGTNFYCFTQNYL
mgnify:CR=1 FL=1